MTAAPPPPTGTVRAMIDPKWAVPPPVDEKNRALQIYHDQHGWLTFVLPDSEAAAIAAWLIRPRA